jgi:hypothetical protein
MANIFKTTLKKDVIADIANGKKREVRFPITKFWASRFSIEYNLDSKEFMFKTFDSLELSSPSNKETGAMTYTYEFVRTFVDGEEFVIEFKEIEDDSVVSVSDENNEQCCVECENNTELIKEQYDLSIVEDDGCSDLYFDDLEEFEKYNSNDDMLNTIEQWFGSELILDNLYDSDSVFATNARQVIILPNGKVLGFNKQLPLNNDVEIRVEFDMNKKVYFDSYLSFETFVDEIFKTLDEIQKNNFVFIWKRHTGVFMEEDGRIYFGIRYSTRKSIGLDRKYNVQ